MAVTPSSFGSVLPGPYRQVQDAITAIVSGDQDTSQPLVYGENRVTVSANDTDGVLLPPAVAKAEVWLFNDDSAQDVQVYATGSDTINGTAGATGIAVGQQTYYKFFCLTDGVWHAALMSSTFTT